MDLDKSDPPAYTYSPPDNFADHGNRSRRSRRRRRDFFRVVVLFVIGCTIYFHWFSPSPVNPASLLSIDKLRTNHEQCTRLRSVAKDPSGERERNGRYAGGRPILIRNATIWTGQVAPGTSEEQERRGEGYAWTQADVLLEHGLIKRIASSIGQDGLPENCTIYDGTGRLLTAGIVDMHSHTGVDSLPETNGNSDTNELSNNITPYVRSLDAINPLDHQMRVIKSGGVTTSLILPGSGNNMGGEAFVIKLAVGKEDGRPELSIKDMLADPERNWRYMKMACGENAKGVYGKEGRNFGPFSRMGEAWYFRHALEQAQKYVNDQNDWCATADRLGVEKMPNYLPESLEWESLGALLRGQVLLNTHCYTVSDLESFISHTNEFKFSVRAFHHAHQTYLVPEVLKRNYGGRPPAAALFADNMYYKMEAYIASEQAGSILYENGITPVYVSDNPVINAQHVVFEAAKAYRNGLPYHVALAGVTSASADLLGLGQRIGKIQEGFDADLVLWDSDPLSIGATPVQIWIDGTPQYERPVELKKPAAKPLEHDWPNEPLSQSETPYKNVIFTNVSTVILPNRHRVFSATPIKVVVDTGKISCIGPCTVETEPHLAENYELISLRDGHVVPPAIAFGSYLGIEEVAAEKVTQDGANTPDSFSHAIDGLSLDGKALEAAYAHGVTRAISAPAFVGGGHRGISVDFHVAAKHALEKGAILHHTASVHYPMTLAAKQGKTPSISSAVNVLRQKLLAAIKTNATLDGETTAEALEAEALRAVVRGELPLVITVHKADTIAALISLKTEIDKHLHDRHEKSASPLVVENNGPNLSKNKKMHRSLRLVILGGAEAHLVATELASSSIPVVLAPSFPYATSWEQRRSLTGAPLTNGTAIDVLHNAGVLLALGTAEDWEVRNLYLMAGIAHVNSNGKISAEQALNMISGNVDEILGFERGKMEDERHGDKEKTYDEMAVFDGDPLEIGSRLRAVADGRGHVDVWREKV